MKTKQYLVVFFGVLLLLFAIFSALPSFSAQFAVWQISLQTWLQASLQALAPVGLLTALYFFFWSALLIMFGLPRLIFYGLGGFVFGFWHGLLLSISACLVGSLLAFRLIRYLNWRWQLHARLKAQLNALLNPQLNTQIARQPDCAWPAKLSAQLRAKLHAKPSSKFVLAQLSELLTSPPRLAGVALLRVLPLSNLLLNIAFALSQVRTRDFLCGSLLGFLPQGVIAVLMGSGIHTQLTEGSGTSYFIPFILPSLAFVLLLFLVRRKYLAARAESGI